MVYSNLKNERSNLSSLSTSGSQIPLRPALLPPYPTLICTPVPYLPSSPASLHSTGQAPLDLELTRSPVCTFHLNSGTSQTSSQNQSPPHKRPNMVSVRLRGQPWAAFQKALAGSATNTALPFINTAREDPELRKARARLGCAQGISFPGAELARVPDTGLNSQGATTHFRGLEKVVLTPFS